MKILLVDAGHAELSELAKQLRSAARVQVASGGLFALTLLERERPDAVLTRAHVGDMSGAELCGLVKKDRQLGSVRMVLLAKTLGEKVSAELAGAFDRVLLDDRPAAALAASLARLLDTAAAAAGGAAPGARVAALKTPAPAATTREPSDAEDSGAAGPPRPALEKGIAGTLGVLSFAELTQALSQTGKTGRLILDTAEQPAMVLFHKGLVRHAVYRNSTGLAAFGGLFTRSERAADLSFRFEPMSLGQIASGPRTLDRTAQELLLAAAVDLDHRDTADPPTGPR